MRRIVLLVLAGWLAGCASTGDAPVRAKRSAPAKLLTGERTPPPPGVDAAVLLPRTGEALTKARLSYDDILASLPQPTYLKPAADDTPKPETDDGDGLPLAAQRAYMEGRLAWRDGRNFDAVQALQRAQRLAPNAAPVVRLMGMIYATSGNRVRGAQLLEQAVRLNPDDIESLVHLAMHAQDQGRDADAIATFHRALTLAKARRDLDPALLPLARFYLGNALERGGYDAAAIQQYTPYLELPRHFARSTAMVRELVFLYRQRAATWQTVGDLHNRLGDTTAALEAYRHAVETEGGDPLGVMSRVVYTHARRGEAEAAWDAAIQVVQQVPGDERGAAMVRYLVEVGAAAAADTQAIARLYREGGRPTSLALALVELLPPDEAIALMNEHLASQPTDVQVYRRLIAQVWTGQADDMNGAVAAVRAAAAAIDREPAVAREYQQVLQDRASSAAVLADAAAQAQADAAHPAAVRFIAGVAMLQDRRVDEAAAALREAMDADPRLLDARVMLARLLIEKGEVEEALALLDAVGDVANSDVVALRVRVLADTGRTEEALSLLDRQMQADPTNLDLVLYKATLQIRGGDSVAAERTLQDALNQQPSAERLYEALFDLYDSNAAPPDAVRQYQRLLRRAVATIPASRVARLQQAKLHDARGEFREAEQLLRTLLEEKPDDPRVLATLLDVLVRAGRRDQADALIEARLTATEQSRDLLRVAYQHYDRTGNQARRLTVLERLLLKEPDSPAKARDLARIYLQSDRPAMAMDVLLAAIDQPMDDPTQWVMLLGRAATRTGRLGEGELATQQFVARHPDHEADLLFEWAMVVERRGERARSQQMMRDLLTRHPDHAPTNNAQGYAWANEGIHLEQARQMIQRAVDQDANAAYLDSLGWVYYKLGQFDEAVQWLRRSKAAPGGAYPVILDHLGDALYRQGRRNEAVREWEAALQAMSNLAETPEDDPELIDIAQRVRAKLEAAKVNQPAPVADVPGQAAPAGDAPPPVDPEAIAR